MVAPVLFLCPSGDYWSQLPHFKRRHHRSNGKWAFHR